ncbi:type II toxin-antitoxin system PemK/MazF family toxin [Paenibacillus sp. FSL H7-0331]|uniref:type II toxin-antitoxin system PemK/MazF family toxin n=1 Tax=Paenibacillus sp. FSL H7-0331 TaxID=1920421 RepID=UPI00096D0B70|nr:type II toxin-antitoxin system PemK/MazF family toxin [Paenibacillus sp. FSL H7-0331]OME91094.1 hypothetical protein BK127_42170 [Paenibacillus sp. FSL H7-0331]
MVLERPKTNNQPIKVHNNIRRGSIWVADISGVEGSIQGGSNRPVVVLQNEIGNRFAPTVIIAPLSSSTTKRKLPTHVEIPTNNGVLRESIVLLEQVRVIDQWCLINEVTQLSDEIMIQVDKALAISVGLGYLFNK